MFVSGLSGQVTNVTATIKGLSHTATIDIDALLSAPTTSKNLFLLSDAGGDNNGASNVNLTFDDAAAGPVPSPIVSGTYKPTNINSVDQPTDPMPAPAPTPTTATTMASLNGGSPNGTWSLWVVDDATGDSGAINNGWCLTITSQSPTTTAVTAAPNPVHLRAERHPDGERRGRRQPGHQQGRSSSATAAPTSVGRFRSTPTARRR